MAAKTPIRTVFDGSNNATGLAEFQSGEFVALTHGGLGASLSIGSAGQVLKVNSGGSALEFGTVEAVFNIDGMADGTGITVADGDVLAISDGGTEKRINASQLKTYIQTNTGATPIINLDIDGGTDIGAALADADLLIVDDGAGGTNRKATMARVATYIESGISGDITISSGTAAIGSGVIVNADINASAAIADSKLATISTAGKVDIGALDIDGASEMGAAIADADLLIVDDGAGGTEKSMLASRIPTYVFTKVSGDATVASNGALTIAAGAVENSMLADDAVGADELAANAVVTASIVDDNVTQAKIADDAVGADQLAANAVVTASIVDDNITQAKIADDAVGADQLASNAVVNASVASNAAIAISKTALTAGTGISLSTDTLNVDAAQTGITSLLATDIKIGEDNETKIDFETADEIHFYAANAEQVFVSDGVFGPQTDSDVDLGTTGARFKDAFMDSVTVTGNLSIGGNFTVNGTTSTVNSTTVTIDDPIFTLGGDSAPGSDDNKDRGIEFRYHTGSAAKVGFFGFDDSTGKFTFIPDATNSSEVFSGTAGTVVATTFEGALTGNVTGNVSGTAATVTTAAQSNITSLGTLTTLTVDNVIVNGTTIGHTDDTDLMTLADGVLTVAGEVDAVSLDVSGDADIDGTLEADAITIGGVTLAETISDTVGAMVTSNTESGITVAYNDSDNTLDFTVGTLNQNTTGSAATLTTARTIAGQSFDGSANITIASTDLSNTSNITLNDATQTLTNKTLTTPIIDHLDSTDSTEFVLDATGHIALDADGGNVYLRDGGTQFARFANRSGAGDLDLHINADKSFKIKGTDGGSNVDALLIDIAAAGAATFNSTVTANAGVIVDNITIDGTEIDLSSGDLTIDVAGKTVIDSDDGGTLQLVDGGTSYLKLFEFSNYAALESMISDNDFKIRGNDGGSFIDALTFDMSAAGAATFNDKIVLGANKSIEFGDSGETITGDGTNLQIVSSNALGFDVANGITLDSGSGGTILKAGGGTTYGTLTSSSGDLSINQTTSDKDIIFTGNDGGSTIEAMRIDMSEGGRVGIGTASPARDLHLKKSTNGNAVRLEVNNTSNTSGSNGVISIYSGGTSGGDPFLHFKVDGGEQYSIGIDNDQSDAFVLANNFGVGSSNLLSIATDGSASFTEKIIMGTNKEVQFVDTNESIKSDGSKLIIKSGGTTFNLPTADGSADQILATDGSGTLSFADAGGASSGFSESTLSTLPGKDGNFDLAKTNNAGDAESGFTSGGTDSFGVALGSVFTMMEPVGSNTDNNTDLGASESHVGA